MQIAVTQEHIDKGCKGEASNCPIALALNDATGLYATIFTTLILCNRPEQTNDDKVFEQKTPCHVVEWIADFDLGRKVEPFEFEIDYENPEDPTIQAVSASV